MLDVQHFHPSDPEFSAVLEELHYDLYQRPEYVQLEGERNDAIPEVVLVKEGDCLLFIPYLLRRCNDVADNLPDHLYDAISPYGYSGLLLNEAAKHSPGFPDRALVAFRENLLARGICSVFLRLHPILNESDVGLFSPGTFTENGETVSIDLRLENLWAPTKSGRRSTINKCKRLGMEAKMVPFSEGIDAFVKLYEETMDRVSASNAYYEFDKGYFQKMQASMADYLHLCLVEYEGKVACGGLYFECGGIVQSALGGTCDEYVHLSPSSLETDFARYWFKDRGNDFLHLGGGVGGSKEDSVYRFKSGFSKLRHPFHTMRMVVDEAQYQNLVSQRAKFVGAPVSKLAATEFFPSYRAS